MSQAAQIAPTHKTSRRTLLRHSIAPAPRSPLRYPGGKSRAIKILMDYVPDDVKTICSPFFGGGSFEIALADTGRKVFAYDAFAPLINFWQHTLQDAKSLAQLVEEKYFPLEKENFYQLQRALLGIRDNKMRAAAYFTLNRCSFSGCTLAGGMSPSHPRFTKSAINRLANFSVKNLHVKQADFAISIPRHNDAFLYLDPPYYLPQKLYGTGEAHTDFDHEKLAQILRQRDGWILSYNDCRYIRELYTGYEIVRPSWVYGMCNGDKMSREILIKSKDLTHNERQKIR